MVTKVFIKILIPVFNFSGNFIKFDGDYPGLCPQPAAEPAKRSVLASITRIETESCLILSNHLEL